MGYNVKCFFIRVVNILYNTDFELYIVAEFQFRD